MTLRERLEAATCQFHGFGPGQAGDRLLREHIDRVQATVEKARSDQFLRATGLGLGKARS